ncbi:MAG: DUF2878 domain-containing protein [Burkholderiales bacterium]|nr:DUF2878 domain-containing protein [Burkholderiales bacterium]
MRLFNFVAYQIGWFACVLGAAHGLWWLGPAVVLPLAAVHVWFARHRQSALLMLLAVTLTGSAFDQALLSAGWVQYPSSPWPASVLPVWMAALWLSFATTLNVSTRWLRNHPVYAAALGAIGGLLAYAGGARLGAMTWLPDRPMAVVLCLGFGLLVPLQFKIAARFDGFGE